MYFLICRKLELLATFKNLSAVGLERLSWLGGQMAFLSIDFDKAHVAGAGEKVEILEF